MVDRLIAGIAATPRNCAPGVSIPGRETCEIRKLTVTITPHSGTLPRNQGD
jgi:hypothetical protein